MTCKYFDCGFCYAPEDVETNATQGGCFEPEYCPYRKSQMTNPEIIVEQKKYGSAMDYTMKVFQRLDEDTVKIDGVEYKKVEPPKPQTLFEIIREWWVQDWTGDSEEICEQLVDTIERWMSQYKCDYVVCAEYLQGYNALMEILKENLK